MVLRRINVVDMQHNNPVVAPDFAALKASGIFAIVHKATEGIDYIDPSYDIRKKAALDAGLLWGAYHFLNASDETRQADNFLRAVGNEQLMLACNYEQSLHPPTLKQCVKFMAIVDRHIPGVQCVLYSGSLLRETLQPSKGGYVDPDMIAVDAFFQQHRLWLAEYGPKDNVPWPWSNPIMKSSNEAAPIFSPNVWLWQLQEQGRINPLVDNTGGNFFDGSFEQLKTRWMS